MSGHFKERIKSLGVVVPTNNLDGRNQPQRIVRLSPLPPPSPPPAKRKKVEENYSHTQAVFTPAIDLDKIPDTQITRKRSLDDISDSQQTLKSQPSHSRRIQPNVSEYRSVENYVAKKPLRKRHKHEPSESADRISIEELDIDNDSDGDIECIEASPQPRRQKPPLKGNTHFISTFAPRFGNHGKGLPKVNHPTPAAVRMSKVIDNAGRNNYEGRNGKLKNLDSSPDELAPDVQDMRGRVSTKRPVTPSPSLSKRGDIAPTKFSASSHAKPNNSEDTTSESILDRAKGIISSRLLIVRAVSGRYKYDVHRTSSVDECFLKLRDVSHVLHPTNLNGEILKKYSFLTINLKKISAVSIPSTPDCRLVSISRSSDAATSASARLVIEFKYPEDVQHFKDWVEMNKGDGLRTSLSIFEDQAKLDRQFAYLMGAADRWAAIMDEPEVDQPEVGDDIKFIQLKEDRARQAKSVGRPQVSKSHVKTKDLMRLSEPSAPSNPEVTVIPDNPRVSTVQRPVRTTRSTFALKSPSLASESPEPEGWTVQNQGWEKNWRNSLVFPPHGKNRATVDKEDIPRLDEGQFLNDNVLIFYLRYLQHSLEAERPDLAQRIYFQNTFFYEKLKSSRSGINYDSVKTWTSKVDLFTKDYIIVPINEFSHWYVAIIYNAPKLIPSAEKEISDAQSTDTITIEEDTQNSGEASTALSKDNNLPGPTNAEAVISTAQNDMMNHLSPIDSEDQKEELQSSGHGQDVELIREKSDPKTDAEQNLPHGPSRQTKPNKRQSLGPRNTRKYDPNQPRIITLDSLGITHSPACGSLKQYLIAELKDKKNIDVLNPGALGMTAKNVPQQTNHCDCGLFLLGYIRHFLQDPDTFVRSILQHKNDIPWNLNPPQLRNEIRNLIFDLQREQQNREDAHKEGKRNKNGPRKKSSVVELQCAPPAKAQVTDERPSKPLEDYAAPKEDGTVAKSNTRSPTPGASSPTGKFAPDLNEGPHLPGSFPQSPVVSRPSIKDSSVAVDGGKLKQTDILKFVQPLHSSSGESSPSRPIVVEDSTPSPEKSREFIRGHTDPIPERSPTETLDELVKERRIPTYTSQAQEETSTISPFFAGRHPTDRMPSARLHRDPDRSRVVVDLSD
ncbi:cysteine proteinase [Rostrohypoxylon terebratum]|nr:cysteine proteinase [Rostrohypoxylon terebratum]